MFSMGARGPKRLSSMPMRRKDKEHAKLERIAMRNKQNSLTNVSQSNLNTTLKEEILHLEKNITIQKKSLTIMESQLKQKYEELKGIINADNLKQEMQQEQIAKNNVLESVKNELFNDTISTEEEDDEDSGSQPREEGGSGSQPREDGDSGSQPREEEESGSQPQEDGELNPHVELIIEEKKTEKSKRKNKRSKKVTQENNEPEQLMF